MHVIVDCLGCGRTFKTRAEYAGKRVECPACRRVIQIPATGQATLAAAPVTSNAERVAAPAVKVQSADSLAAVQPPVPSTPVARPPVVATVVACESIAPPVRATLVDTRSSAAPPASPPPATPSPEGPPPLPAVGPPPQFQRPGLALAVYGTPPAMAHRLTRAPIGQHLLWNTLTLNIFGTIHLNLLHGRMPRLRPNDPSASRAIGFLFIPLFNLYWMFFTYRRLVDRLDEQRTMRGLPPTGLRDLATKLCILTIVSLVLWFLIIPGLVHWLLVMPLFLTRVLREVNALVEASAQPPADDAEAAVVRARVMAHADREYRHAWGGALYVWAAVLLGLTLIFGVITLAYGLSPPPQPPAEVDKLPGVICLLFFATLSAVPAVMSFRRGRRMRRDEHEPC